MKANKLLIALLSITILLSVNVIAQDFTNIDTRSKKAPSSATKSIEKLADFLNEGTNNDLEKIRAYYIWLTHNISYDTKTFFSGNPNPKTKAIDALQRRTAICQGYSELFKELCLYSNIQCMLVSGYSKGYGFNPKQKLSKSDHAWNIVFIENKWQHIDATWGAGYVDNNRKFVKKFHEEFFLAKPEDFILKHLPTDPMWQLLPCPISINDYLKSDKEIQTIIGSKNEVCFSFNDTINEYLALSPENQQVASAERALRFNPDNYEVVGYAFLNLAFELSQGLQALYDNNEYNKALKKNYQILEINQKAYTYLSKSKSDQAKQAANICKQNIDLMKKNIEGLKDFLKKN